MKKKKNSIGRNVKKKKPTNLYNVPKFITNYKELVLKLLSIHKGGSTLASLWKTFKSHFKYDLDYQIVGHENVHKLLEAKLEFVWIQKLCEG
jgi:DUF438 domain-containing protein